MNLVAPRYPTPRRWLSLWRCGAAWLVLALGVLAAPRGVAAEKAVPPAGGMPAPSQASPSRATPEREAPASGEATAEAATGDGIVTLAAYNAKADRIEDFGVRVRPGVRSSYPKTAVGAMFTRYVPIVSAVLPNTAAARAGLQPGDRILKSDGQSLVTGLFSSIQLTRWNNTQKKKWAEVAAGKSQVTWTLEIETPSTGVVRTVKLVVPTPPPHWGSARWRKPEGRTPAVVSEAGPLAERSREVLDHGMANMLFERYSRLLGLDFRGGLKSDFASGREPTGYAWILGDGATGTHEIFVTQFRGRTDVFFYTRSPGSGLRFYLTSPSGILEKAWFIPLRGRDRELSLEEARVGFEHERDLWALHVQPGTGRWPFEIKPGYDASAIFARLAPQAATPTAVAPPPVAADFLKLRLATDAERALFDDAWGKLGTEHDRWAYTETSRGIEDRRLLVTRVDPSQPEASRCVLLSVDGKPPTPAQIEEWRADGGDVPKPLGELPALAGLVDLKGLRVFKEEPGAVIFELPTRGGGEFSPDKFQALFRVGRTSRAFESITVKLRDSVRVAGVVKVTDAGLEAQFQTLDPALAPQPVRLQAGGGARVLFVKFSRTFEATRTDYKRVTPATDSGLAKNRAHPSNKTREQVTGCLAGCVQASGTESPRARCALSYLPKAGPWGQRRAAGEARLGFL